MGGGLSRSQADEEKAEDEIARLRRNTSMRSWAKNALLQPKEEEAPAALSPVKPVDSIVPVDPREGLKDELARQLVKLIALCNAPDAIPAWAREVEGMEQDLLRFKDSISAKEAYSTLERLKSEQLHVMVALEHRFERRAALHRAKAEAEETWKHHVQQQVFRLQGELLKLNACHFFLGDWAGILGPLGAIAASPPRASSASPAPPAPPSPPQEVSQGFSKEAFRRKLVSLAQKLHQVATSIDKVEHLRVMEAQATDKGQVEDIGDGEQHEDLWGHKSSADLSLERSLERSFEDFSPEDGAGYDEPGPEVFEASQDVRNRYRRRLVSGRRREWRAEGRMELLLKMHKVLAVCVDHCLDRPGGNGGSSLNASANLSASSLSTGRGETVAESFLNLLLDGAKEQTHRSKKTSETAPISGTASISNTASGTASISGTISGTKPRTSSLISGPGVSDSDGDMLLAPDPASGENADVSGREALLDDDALPVGRESSGELGVVQEMEAVPEEGSEASSHLGDSGDEALPGEKEVGDRPVTSGSSHMGMFLGLLLGDSEDDAANESSEADGLDTSRIGSAGSGGGARGGVLGGGVAGGLAGWFRGGGEAAAAGKRRGVRWERLRRGHRDASG